MGESRRGIGGIAWGWEFNGVYRVQSGIPFQIADESGSAFVLP